MAEEKIKICGKEYYIPCEINTEKHKHREKDKWTTLYFYKDRKKTSVKKNQIKNDLVITSALEYQKDIFYKMSQLSAEDDCFDYFFRLKENIPSEIIKKNSRYKINKRPSNAWKHIKRDPNSYEKSDDGKFIVRFN